MRTNLAAATLAVLLLALAAPSAGDQTVTLKGQVTCSECWFEADRKTTKYGTSADYKCAVKCGKSDIPAALAVEEKGDFRLYLLEDGAFKREGTGWLKYIGKDVQAKGTLRAEPGGKKTWLKVDALTVLEAARK